MGGKRFVLCGIMALAVFWVNDAVQAEEFLIREGLYVSGSVQYFSLQKEFNDDYVVTNSEDPATATEFYMVPDVKKGTGWGVGGGLKTEDFAVELNYVQTTHDAYDSLLGKKRATYRAINADFKLYVQKKSRIKPFLLAGISFPQFEVPEDGVVLPSGIVDETFTGIGSKWGAGVEYYLSPQLAVVTSVYYHLSSFSEVEGIDFAGIDGSGPGANIGCAYTF